MKYIVVEIQKNVDGSVGNLVSAYDDINAAQSKYHAVLSAAALSQLPCHAAVLLNETGYCIVHEHFIYVEPEPPIEEVQPGDGEGEEDTGVV